MNRLISVLGTIALIVVGLYICRAALYVTWDIFDELYYFMRHGLLPKLVWFAVIAGVLYILFGRGDRL